MSTKKPKVLPHKRWLAALVGPISRVKGNSDARGLDVGFRYKRFACGDKCLPTFRPQKTKLTGGKSGELVLHNERALRKGASRFWTLRLEQAKMRPTLV